MSSNFISKNIRVDSIDSREDNILPLVPVDPVFVSPPKMGSIVFDPNTKRVYIGDGTQWVSLGTVRSISQGTGIVCTPNPITSVGTISLANTAVVPGTYGNAVGTKAQFTVDQQGRLTAASSVPVTLPDTAVVPGTYGNSTTVGQFTVDQQGRLTAAVNVPIAFPAAQLQVWSYIDTSLGAAYGPFQPLPIWDTQGAGAPGFMFADTTWLAQEAGVYMILVQVGTKDFVNSNTIGLRIVPSNDTLTSSTRDPGPGTIAVQYTLALTVGQGVYVDSGTIGCVVSAATVIEGAVSTLTIVKLV